MSYDDRQEFETQKKLDINHLGADESVFDTSKNTMLALDRHNYTYLWSWMGLPIIQWPADIMATQEVIWRIKPDVIIETGVARGGSMVFLASMLKLIGKGKVVGVDIDIRPHNRKAIEEHPLIDFIELIEGASTSKDVLDQVSKLIEPQDVVLVILDSDHSHDHVLDECRSYSSFVTKGSYLIVADTFVGHISEAEAPKNRSQVLFKGNEPLAARNSFLSECDDFKIDTSVNDKLVLSSSPGGYLLRVK